MNRLLGKLFSEWPKEVCWEGTMADQTGDLSSPAARTLAFCQRKTMVKPRSPCPDVSKFESKLVVRKEGLDYCPSEMQASASVVKSSKKHESSFETVKKQEEYERWLNKGRSSLQGENSRQKKSNCSHNMERKTSLPYMPSIGSCASATYLPPRVITNPEVVLNPPVRETLVSVTDRTPPSMQKWAQQLDRVEQYDWLEDIETDFESEEPDADIRALQKSLALEKADTSKRAAPFTDVKTSEEPKKRVKYRKQEVPGDSDANNPLKRCFAYRIQMSKQKVKEDIANKPEEHHSKSIKVTRSSSTMSNLGLNRKKPKCFLKYEPQKFKKSSKPSIGQCLSSSTFQHQPKTSNNFREKIDCLLRDSYRINSSQSPPRSPTSYSPSSSPTRPMNNRFVSFTHKTTSTSPAPPPILKRKPTTHSRLPAPSSEQDDSTTHLPLPTSLDRLTSEKVAHPPLPTRIDNSASKHMVQVEHSTPTKASSTSTEHASSFCQQFLSQPNEEVQSVDEDYYDDDGDGSSASSKYDDAREAFDTDENNVRLFKEMVESEKEWQWHMRIGSNMDGSLVELRQHYHRQF